MSCIFYYARMYVYACACVWMSAYVCMHVCMQICTTNTCHMIKNDKQAHACAYIQFSTLISQIQRPATGYQTPAKICDYHQKYAHDNLFSKSRIHKTKTKQNKTKQNKT
jgi:hypothetical protein